MRELLKAVLTRLSGRGGEVASIIRLDTQYGGGKTHSLIALVHAVRGMKGVENVAEFVDPILLPKFDVRVAALDGENCDPADGLTLEPGLRAKTLWGELAYRLAGAEGYRRVQESDQKHVAPDAETLCELFGGQPAIIMLDEVSVFGPIRDEITTRLGQGDYAPALKSDVAAVKGDDPAVAQVIDTTQYPGQLPITSYIARTVFLHTLAFGDSAKGISPDHLKFCVCSPKVEPSFVEQARIRFVTDSLFLDDRPGALMRFMVEANLTQIIRRQMEDIEGVEVRNELQERIRLLFGAAGGAFNLAAFPAGAYEVDDGIGDGRPLLVAIHYDAFSITTDPQGLPPVIEDIFRHKGQEQKLREFRNNLVFVTADQRQISHMKDRVRRRLALQELLKPDHMRELAEHQQNKIKEEFQKSALSVAEAILHGYRHLFFPYHLSMPGSTEPIAHAAIEVHNASDSPGNGQLHVARVLRDHHKLLSDGDTREAPAFVRDQTPLKQKGEISTFELRNEYRRAPRLSMLVSDSPLINEFQITFDGRLDKANAVKSFLDPQLRSAEEHDFTATYTLAFASALSTAVDKAEAFSKALTKYGSGEAYVEAHAAAQELKGGTP